MEYLDGYFVVTTHKTDPQKSTDVSEWLNAHTPQGRINRLRSMAAQVGITVTELDEAQEIADTGTSGKRGQIFDRLLYRAERSIQNAAKERAEAVLLPLAEHGKKFKPPHKKDKGPVVKILRDIHAGGCSSFDELLTILRIHSQVDEVDEDGKGTVYFRGKNKGVTFKTIQNVWGKIKSDQKNR